jgi:hypothetical protein
VAFSRRAAARGWAAGSRRAGARGWTGALAEGSWRAGLCGSAGWEMGAFVAADLSPLERAAARVGLGGWRAREVPADRRRGVWFTFRDGEILVSERVLERCPPADACALMMDTILMRRRWSAPRRVLAGSLILDAVLLFAAAALMARGAAWVAAACFVAALTGLIGVAVGGAIARARAAVLADDETVALLGDPTPLVRGLNLMNQDEIHLGGRRWSARPDLHRRAERLARLHKLCSGPTPAPHA